MGFIDHSSIVRFRKLWDIGCSLKLAIALASVATLLIMLGSLVMHFNPEVFSDMEQDIMIRWLPQAWHRAPSMVFWIPLTGACVLLFSINTLCCLIDWLYRISARWRKLGEYLVHAGFILLVVAYCWGNINGFRSGPQRIFPGQRIAIPERPGLSLQLDAFMPRLAPSGRPLDMVNRVSLWQGEQQVVDATVSINHPLIHDGLVILASSFGQDLYGFRFLVPGRGVIDLTAGSQLTSAGGLTLIVQKLLPDARQLGPDRVVQAGSRPGNPALLLSLQGPSGPSWQGWYFLHNKQPAEVAAAGFSFRPVGPVYKHFSLLTINRDPGDKLALAGGLCISTGVMIALFSFYRKRARGDRLDI
jgi:cytochrome c biogenesis protein